MTTQDTTTASEVELRGTQGANTGGLLQHAVETASRLVAGEIQLAKQELIGSLKAAVMALIGGVAAVFAVIAFLAMAIVAVVTAASPHWAAALGFAVLFLLVAGGGALFAVRKVKQISPLRETVQTLKEDIDWAKQQLTHDSK